MLLQHSIHSTWNSASQISGAHCLVNNAGSTGTTGCSSQGGEGGGLWLQGECLSGNSLPPSLPPSLPLFLSSFLPSSLPPFLPSSPQSPPGLPHSLPIFSFTSHPPPPTRPFSPLPAHFSSPFGLSPGVLLGARLLRRKGEWRVGLCEGGRGEAL